MNTNAPLSAEGLTIPAFHPGIMLAEELEFRGLTSGMLASKIHVPRNRLTAIIKGTRAITADTALRLERCLGIKAYLWLRLQTAYDLSVTEAAISERINREIVPEPSVGNQAA